VPTVDARGCVTGSPRDRSDDHGAVGLLWRGRRPGLRDGCDAVEQGGLLYPSERLHALSWARMLIPIEDA
jgi:hypothetical protein